MALSGICFGSLSVFNRQLAAAGVAVPQMLMLRFLGASLVLWALVLVGRRARRLEAGQVLGFSGLGVLYVAEAWLYFESSQRIPIALTALLLYLFPSLVVLSAWVLFREAPGPRGLGALGLSALGIGLAVGTPGGRLDLTGVLLGAGTALVYTVYVLAGARLQRGVDPLFGSAILMSVATGGFAVGAYGQGALDLAPVLDAPWAIAGLAIVGTAIPIPLLLFGIARIGPSRAAIISTLEPISAALCGLVFLSEPMTGLQWAGALCVVGGVALAARR